MPKDYPDSKERVHDLLVRLLKEAGVGTGERGWIGHDMENGEWVRDPLSLEGELLFGMEAIIEQQTALRNALQLAIDRLVDMLKGDDGQAWKEAERVLPLLRDVLENAHERHDRHLQGHAGAQQNQAGG